MAQVIEGGDLTINEPLFLHEGEFLREADFRNYEKSQTSKQDYEYRFSNLNLGPNGILYTLGNNVRIHAQNFISMGGTIASFPEGQTSLTGDGRHGGHVVLWAQNGEGVLNLFIRGENGKMGDQGDPPSSDLKGNPGKNGEEVRFCVVSLKDLNGGVGDQGRPGNTGQNGHVGGDSGTAVVTVQSSLSFKVAIDISEGKGGQGGKGGLGGEGGDGGIGGASACSKTRAENGKPGPQGSQGNPGRPAANGSKQTVCLEINKLSQCDAKSFNYSR